MWYHGVITHKGPNVMYNVRSRIGKKVIGQSMPTDIFRAIRFFAAGLFNVVLGGQANVHRRPGLRWIRLNALHEPFYHEKMKKGVEGRELRWENIEQYTELGKYLEKVIKRISC